MKRKILAVVLAATLLVSGMAGCAQKGSDTTDKTSPASTNTSQTGTSTATKKPFKIAVGFLTAERQCLAL